MVSRSLTLKAVRATPKPIKSLSWISLVEVPQSEGGRSNIGEGKDKLFAR